jgi:hypothetical protein
MNLPSVLVPGLDLGVGKIEFGSKFLTILHAQVLLFLKASLQSLELIVSEGCPGFALFAGIHLSTGGRVLRG